MAKQYKPGQFIWIDGKKHRVTKAPSTLITMARKQYKPGQFYWIKGCKYRIARVERHVQDPCDFCALSDICSPSMMNWCANLMPTHYYFKKC